ncbi:NUDIX domain-containing protein [Paenibacillus sp. TRM 82003]|nr:NUDIX domain-containing protein [Paenibacillus sp. TRM 82003]
MGLRKYLYKIARIYWRVRRPVTMGSRAIVIKDGNVLLVRLSYQEGWYLPGGGVKKGESFQTAVIREMAEECGIKASNPRLLQIFTSQFESKIDHIALFEIIEFDDIPQSISDAEIIEIGFFPLNNLPEGTSPATRRRIDEYILKHFTAELW